MVSLSGDIGKSFSSWLKQKMGSMKIKLKNATDILEVYGLYSVEKRRVFLVIPKAGYPGLVAVGEADCDIIEDSVSDDFVLRKNDADGGFLLHWAADMDDLIYDLIENDPEAMDKFMSRLAIENEGGKS